MSTAPPFPAPFPARSARRPRGWGRALPQRRVAHLIAFGQTWEDRSGVEWTVCQIHRRDKDVRLETGNAFRHVTFHELGREYRLEGAR